MAGATTVLSACGGGASTDSGVAVASSAKSAPAPAVSRIARGPNQVANPGFESGNATWVVDTGQNALQARSAVELLYRNYTPEVAPFAGEGVAVLGYANAVEGSLSQDVQVAADAPRAALQFRFAVSSAEVPSQDLPDALIVEVLDPSNGAVRARLGTITSLDRVAAPGLWQLSPAYDLSAYRGSVVRLRFRVATNPTSQTAFLLDDVFVGPVTGAAELAPQNGWWWNPAQPGRGFAIERQGNRIFLAAFLYEGTGAAGWYTGTLAVAGNLFTGTLTRNTGGQSLLGSYRAPTGTTTVATADLSFYAADSASLTVAQSVPADRQTIHLERFAFGGLAAPAATFQSGWWWNEAEPGRGYFIEAQGTQVFSAAFMYQTSGEPVWYTQQGTLNAQGGYASQLFEYRDGQALFAGWRAGRQLSTTPGGVTFEPSGPAAGNLLLPDGRRLPVRRFLFG